MPRQTMPTHTVRMAVMVEKTSERRDMMTLLVGRCVVEEKRSDGPRRAM